MEFIFEISTYNRIELEQQLAEALNKRTEIISRKRLPRTWKFVDWLRRLPKASEKVLQRRIILYRIYGIVLMALGVFVLVPGLMEPRQTTLIITGIICIALGIVYLIPRHKKENNKFQSAAEKLLNGLESLELSAESPIQISFTEKGMAVSEEEAVPYDCFNAAVETDNLYLLTYNEQVTVLQKRDLKVGTHSDFVSFVEEKSNLVFAQVL